MLTVTDGTNTAYLNFDDFDGTFKFATDGGDGTYIYDPPAAGAKDAPATATTAAGNDHAAASPQPEWASTMPRARPMRRDSAATRI